MLEIFLIAVLVILFLLFRQIALMRIQSSELLSSIAYRLVEMNSRQDRDANLLLEQIQTLENSLAMIDRAVDDIRDVANTYERYRLPSQTEREGLDELAAHDEIMRG
jgi:hypothetical protein